MFTASAGFLIGQRGNNIPLVAIHGFEYQFDGDATIEDTVN